VTGLRACEDEFWELGAVDMAAALSTLTMVLRVLLSNARVIK